MHCKDTSIESSRFKYLGQLLQSQQIENKNGNIKQKFPIIAKRGGDPAKWEKFPFLSAPSLIFVFTDLKLTKVIVMLVSTNPLMMAFWKMAA